jgi:hypothetical protein
MIMEMGFENVDWIYLVQDRDRWWVPKNMLMELLVP